MQKRGQVTVFIIIGILILVLLVSFIVLRDALTTLPSDEPQDIKDLIDYAERCILESADQAIFAIGAQGGYFELPEKLRLDTRAQIDIGLQIPFWYYKRSSYVPSKEEMETQLGNYVKDSVLACLDEFSAFDYKYDITIKDDMFVDTTIGLDAIFFIIDYPLTVNIKGTERSVEHALFNQRIQNSLGKRYELAVSLINLENQESFLEFYTDEMIASSDYLPYEGMELGCSPRVWLLQDMKEYTQTLISYNLKFLRFTNTKQFPVGIPYYDKIYTLETNDQQYPDLTVDVAYDPAWPMDYQVHPSRNRVVKPIDFKIRKFLADCVKVYHHKYSLYYPVMFTISDTDEPGYPFNFATPVILKRNEADRLQVLADWPDFVDVIASEDFCAPTEEAVRIIQDPEGKMVPAPVIVENAGQKMNVLAYDTERGFQFGALSDVNVQYHCVKYLCDIGNTSYNIGPDGTVLSSRPHLFSRFPECFNGKVIATKPGYHPASKFVTVDEANANGQITIPMHPVRDLRFTVHVLDERNGLVTERALTQDEVVLIEITNDGLDFEETIVFPVEGGGFTNITLPIGEFTYEVSINLVEDLELKGGALMNWTTTYEGVKFGRFITFNVYSINQFAPTPQERYELFDEAVKKSADHPPVIR